MIGLPSKSTLVKVYPLLDLAGINVNLTSCPVCKPTPLNETGLDIVVCLISVVIIIYYLNF
jgi:hypothetical protein